MIVYCRLEFVGVALESPHPGVQPLPGLIPKLAQGKIGQRVGTLNQPAAVGGRKGCNFHDISKLQGGISSSRRLVRHRLRRHQPWWQKAYRKTDTSA